MPEQSTHPPTRINFSDTELAHIAGNYERVRLEPGDILFDEGTTGECAYIVLDGELEVLKTSGQRQVLLNVIGRGEVVGEMALLQNRPRMASIRARTETTLIGVNREQFNEVLDTYPEVTHKVLEVVLQRERMTEARIRQAQHMTNWNALTAGVAHELNNPAAAIQRGTGQFKEALDQFAGAQMRLGRLALNGAQQAMIDNLLDEIKQRAEHPAALSALLCSTREMEAEDWLDAHGVDRAWELAPVIGNMDWTTERLDDLLAVSGADILGEVVAWMCAAFTAYSLMAEVSGASAHISRIVNLLKGYAFLDQAPVQTLNVHEGLDNTLLILGGRLGDGVQVQRDYAPELPPIQGYGRELNQVWTNLIDNAITAVGDHGEITIRTSCTAERGGWITVEIEDNGCGIDAHIQPVLFEPFVTTKKPGQGTGLGLNICYNIVVEKQKGEITFDSVPGRTVFTVRLPVNFEAQ